MFMEAKRKVMIIEDERSMRMALSEMFHVNDFLVIEANNGEEGVSIALEKRPDLILLDLVMPVMDGMTALAKIREDAWGVSVPVIILTNLSANNEQIVKDMVTYKPVHYLVKSDWKIRDIVKKTEEVLLESFSAGRPGVS
jgi:DNA-binding response OmpR family regulator